MVSLAKIDPLSWGYPAPAPNAVRPFSWILGGHVRPGGPWGPVPVMESLDGDNTEETA